MDLTGALLLLLGGCLAGFLAGLFGVGGGIILVPVLLLYFQSIGVSSLVATHLTFGTSLFIVIFTSLSSAYQYSKNQLVIWKAVPFIGIASVVGALVGAAIASGLQGESLQKCFAVVVAVAAVRLLSETRKPKDSATVNTSPIGLGGIGFVAGTISSLAGVGGGVFSVPMMCNFLKFPLKKALGTSSATIVITALAAATGYVVKGWGNVLLPSYTLGYVDYLHSIPVILGTIPLARLGASTAHKTSSKTLRRVYGIFLLVIALKMFFF